MNTKLDLTINKENNTVNIKREFAADIHKIWDAWTKSEMLDQWWAPEPYHAETKSFDFRVGGMWLYAMVSPENEKQWAKAEYKSIEPLEKISWKDAFCDENGKENPEMPHSLWTINFSENKGSITVTIVIKHDNLTDLEMLMKMGFSEGLAMGFNNLDELLLKS